MNKINLSNRDGANLWLEEITPSLYKLETDSDRFYLEYIRIIGDSNNPEAVDPPGGPFISVGDKFENMIVKKITFPPLLFTLESYEEINKTI